MKAVSSKTIFVATVLSLLFFSVGHANENAEHEHSNWDLDKATVQPMDHHAFVHPFLTHMGMPDAPGELSARIMSVEQRSNGSSSGTYGFHLETGIIDRLGLHLRNDAVKFHDSTEMMLQYAVLRSDSGLNGVSLISEVEFPTGPTKVKTKGGVGVSAAYILQRVLALNSVIHYMPSEKATEWEISLASKLTDKIFPVLEVSGEKKKGEKSIVNALAGLKFKIPDGHALGVAYQVGTTGVRDFDSRLLLQAELNFH
ncbi:MAG: hypothetical protein PHY93_16890 [Bacteriovorax sp.]|nr:hypothetical protein [Bacteriovorax sp.]